MFLQNTNAPETVVESEEIVHESIEMLFADHIAVVQESEVEWQNIQASAMLQEHNAILSESAEDMKKAAGGAIEAIKKWFKAAVANAKKFFAKVFAKIKASIDANNRWMKANQEALSKAKGSATMYSGVAKGTAPKTFGALASKAQKMASQVAKADVAGLTEISAGLKTVEIKAMLGEKAKAEVTGKDLIKQIGMINGIGGRITKLQGIVDAAAKGAETKFKATDKATIDKAKVAYSAVQTYVGSLVTAFNAMQADIMAAARAIVGGKAASKDEKPAEDKGEEKKGKLAGLKDKAKAKLDSLKSKKKAANDATAKNESVAEGEEPVEVVELTESEMVELKDLLLAEAMGTLGEEPAEVVVETEEVVETTEASETSEVVVEGEELEVDLFAEELAAE